MTTPEQDMRRESGLNLAEHALRLLQARMRDGADPVETLDDAIATLMELRGEAAPSSDIPAPIGAIELLQTPDPDVLDLAEGFIQAMANIIIAAYPKSYKTKLLLEVAVSVATGTPVLGRFPVHGQHKVGLVLMEDAQHRIRRDVERLCQGRGVNPADLEGWLYLWFRPPLRLANAAAMDELAGHAADVELELLGIDNWSYVASGNSNDSDDVVPQLQAFSGLRVTVPGLTVLLVHHARKQGTDSASQRLTDIIRNSGSFGAWYDCGILLSRKDETSPVTVRMEMRDRPAPKAFAFVVEDEIPASADNGFVPSGWLRLRASDRSPALVQLHAEAEAAVPAVRDVLTAQPGLSKRQLRKALEGVDNRVVEAAFELLVERGEARYEKPEKPGVAGRCYPETPTVLDRAATVLSAHPRTRADRAAPPVGGAQQHSRHKVGFGDPQDSPKGFLCGGGCGREVGSQGVMCPECTAKDRAA